MTKQAKIDIKRLTPCMAEEYARFFEATPHDDRTVKDELPCYCVTWRSDESCTGENDHWYPTREERRSRAVGFIKAGCIKGYLAYFGGEIVGWCNATEDCKGGVDYLREFWPISERRDEKVKSVFCFMIAPDFQRRGVATKLLERVCADAAEDGFDCVEAYVNKEFASVAFDFRGPLAMYEKLGFIKCAERDGRVVVRKALK